MASLLRNRLFDIILFLSAAASLVCLSAGDTSRCPSSSKTAGSLYTYEGKCYQFILSLKTWVDAKAFCHEGGAALMSVENRAEYDWAVQVLTDRIDFSNNGFWLGLHDRNKEGLWEWDEGLDAKDVKMTWSNWQTGEPNNFMDQDCVYMRKQYDYRWADVGCGDGYGYPRNYAFACEHRRHCQTGTKELSSLRTKNITLDNRIRALEDQLEDAKEHHTLTSDVTFSGLPTILPFERLKDKISKMEDRFSMREIELKKVITQNRVTYQEDLRVDVLKWKSIVQSKNRDIEKFRAELDSILSVLKELRRQGVTIPLAT